MKNLIIGVVLMFMGQSLVWVQTNGQFVWEWFRRNPIILSVIFGSVLSFLFITAARYMVPYFNGALWPVRFIGFGLGILSFTVLTYFFMNEGMNTKTLVSLGLSLIIVLIQIIWK